MSVPRCILLVDDSDDDLMLTSLAFKRAGFSNPLETLRNGEEAIAYLAGEGDYRDRVKFPLPMVVLMDLKMPKKNGFDVLTWLRGQLVLGRIPIIVLTASTQAEDVQRAYELGANSFLVKPAALADLTAMMRCLREWLQYNHFPPLNHSG